MKGKRNVLSKTKIKIKTKTNTSSLFPLFSSFLTDYALFVFLFICFIRILHQHPPYTLLYFNFHQTNPTLPHIFHTHQKPFQSLQSILSFYRHTHTHLREVFAQQHTQTHLLIFPSPLPKTLDSVGYRNTFEQSAHKHFTKNKVETFAKQSNKNTQENVRTSRNASQTWHQRLHC